MVAALTLRRLGTAVIPTGAGRPRSWLRARIASPATRSISADIARLSRREPPVLDSARPAGPWRRSSCRRDLPPRRPRHGEPCYLRRTGGRAHCRLPPAASAAGSDRRSSRAVGKSFAQRISSCAKRLLNVGGDAVTSVNWSRRRGPVSRDARRRAMQRRRLREMLAAGARPVSPSRASVRSMRRGRGRSAGAGSPPRPPHRQGARLPSGGTAARESLPRWVVTSLVSSLDLLAPPTARPQPAASISPAARGACALGDVQQAVLPEQQRDERPG